MASFADSIPQFNPYVSQLPVELMTQVGMYKQQKYEQGVEKLQSYYDNVIGGLDMANEADRQYTQSLINKVGSNMKWLAAGDFSNQQLVNSVGNMAAQITKDPNVLNAVSSTAFYRQQRAKIQKDIDEGKSSPANIDEFDQAASPWLNSKKVGQKFATAYNPFFDVDKFVKEQFDAVKPGNFTFEELYKTNPDGSYQRDAKNNLIPSPVMVRMKKEGRLPKEVEATINQIMADPRVSKQLGITGKYNYKGLDPQNLITTVYDQRDAKLGAYLNRMAELTLDKKLGKNVQADIDALQSNIDTITTSYDELAKTANTNPDGLRGYLYKQAVVDNYKSIFGSVRTSIENVKNPLWEANFEMQKEINEQSRWFQDFQWKINNAREDRAFTAEQNRLNRNNAKEIALLRAKKGLGTNDTDDLDPYAISGINGLTQDVNKSDVDVIADNERQLAERGANLLTKSYDFIWNSMFSGNPASEAVLAKDMAKTGNRELSIKKILTANAKKANKSLEDYVVEMGAFATERVNKNRSTAEPSLIKSLEAYKAAEKAYTNYRDENIIIDRQSASSTGGESIADVLKNSTVPSVDVNYNGKKYTIDKQDFHDAAIYLSGHRSVAGGYSSDEEVTAAKAAEARLAERGKAFILPTVLDRYGTSTTRTVDPLTGIVRGFKDITNNIRSRFGGGDTYLTNASGAGLGGGDVVSRMFPGSVDETSKQFKGSLDQAYGMINNKKVELARAKKVQLLKESNFFKPQMKGGILTGDNETDENTYNKLKLIAGNYLSGAKNYADISDIKGFATGISKEKPDAIEVKTFVSPTDARILTQVVSYDANGVSGRVVLSDEEATDLKANMSAIYEADAIADIRRKIKLSDNRRTSRLDPNDIDTYHKNDAYFTKPDFPRMSKTGQGQDLKANFKYESGLWFPVVYARDANGREGVLELDGEFELNTAVKKLTQFGPESIPLIVNK